MSERLTLMSLLVIDPVCGMAGDMFCAALLDLGVEKQEMIDVMQQVARNLGKANINCQNETRLDIRGIRLNCEYTLQDLHSSSDFLSEILQKAYSEHSIHGEYKEYADRTFSILKQAEQAAHKKISGGDQKKASDHHAVHLHEAQDIIVDIIGSAWALQQLDVQLKKVCCVAPVAVGGGEIRFSHGSFSVPAPATAEIVARYAIPTASGPVDTELLTPTGAALLAALGPTFVDRAERSFSFPQLVRSGVGFGSTFFESKDKASVNALFLFLMALQDG